MKVVILDDLSGHAPTKKELELLDVWFRRVARYFPSGKVQIYSLPLQRQDLYAQLIKEAP